MLKKIANIPGRSSKIAERLIFLIGFMGVGKSTIGRLLSKKMHCAFLDLDEAFELYNKQSIRSFLLSNSEMAFREKERETFLHYIPHLSSSTIVATGGGFPCFFDNMSLLKSYGYTIYLQATAEVLYERIKNNSHQYPLLGEVITYEQIEQMLDKREKTYKTADYTFCLNHFSIDRYLTLLLSAFNQ